MTHSRLHVYNSQHHDCTTLGELHGLADAMRWELLHRVEGLEAELAALRERRCENCVSKGAVAYADTSHPACSCRHDARWNDLGYACNRWADRGEA